MTLRPITLTAFLIAVAGPLIANAEVDTSPKPGGVFKLKPGVYVSQGQSCADPANAALRIYSGKGIRGSATHDCVARIVKARNNRFTVDQSCIDTPAGTGKRAIERQTITVSNALEFVLENGGHSSTYHYCPTYELPDWLRSIQG